MITFHDPWLLLLLLLVPPAVWWRYTRHNRPALQFSHTGTLNALPATWRVRIQPIFPVLYALGLMALCVAMARPQKGLSESKVNTEGVDIVLLVDVSTSMRAEDFSDHNGRMNRLEAAKRVLRSFIERRPDDRLGLAAFAGMPYTAAPLTLDHSWLFKRLEDLQTGMIEDGTAIGDALASGINRLRDSEARSKIIILLTDGMNNAGMLTPDKAAEAAKALNIRIYTVGAGSRGTAPYPTQTLMGMRYVNQPVEIDEDMLKRIAQTTGGSYFRAGNFDELERIYESIDQMEKTKIEIEHFTRYKELFGGWLFAGLILLSLEVLLSLSPLGRVSS